MGPTTKFILRMLASLALNFGLGFAFGYFLCWQVIRFHKRAGSKPPFPPDFLNTKMQWGLMFGVVVAVAMTVLEILRHFKLM